MCPLYVVGLIGPGERKSVQPMAERLGLGAHDRLHHFVSAGIWNAAPLLEELVRKAEGLLGGDDAVLVVDDTALPKEGNASVDVAPQYASALGKQANCQTLVKRRQSARFVAPRVRIADGPPQRIRAMGGAQHIPGVEAWLVGERRPSGERKYYLSNLPADTSVRALAAAIKGRRVCEQAHQQLNEEPGLDHFEGRSWTGLRRHALMTILAYAFLQTQRLSAATAEKAFARAAA